MKKLLFALAILCISSPAWALNPTGTGWITTRCQTEIGSEIQNGYVVKAYRYRPCKKPTFNYIGLRLDAGAPDLLGVSLVGRPLKFAQIELGGTTTLVGGGIRVGLSVFLPWYVSPGINIEYGHQWAGNMNRLIAMFGDDPRISLLNHIEYDYTNLHGSLGFGHPNWFMFRIQAGYSYIWGSTSGLQAYLQNKTNQPLLTVTEANAKIWTPSAKVVFQLYF